MIAVLVSGMLAVGWLSIDAKSAAEPVNPSSIYVIDGDTIDLDGRRFRLVGFDTPEVYSPRCDYEKALGDEATRRLRELIASGELVDLAIQPGKDRYDRGLARLYVGREDVAETMISEGLARPYRGGQRKGWCE
ncbi:thermonuclease family protein [Roseivivax halotolerans]|uniref:thermonuclease family protein n=1 Tax=Roseivivax halotolerans TaxID=93684 RepID=UPI001587F110|nr:thermonuclease family protein [Roseivivax halotolerans]